MGIDLMLKLGSCRLMLERWASTLRFASRMDGLGQQRWLGKVEVTFMAANAAPVGSSGCCSTRSRDAGEIPRAIEVRRFVVGQPILYSVQ